MDRKTVINVLHECLMESGAQEGLEEMASSFLYLLTSVYKAMGMAADRLCDEKTWNKVEDKMPEDNTVVLTYYRMPEFDDDTSLAQVCPYDNVDGFDMHNGHRVTHWRPLPADPED